MRKLVKKLGLRPRKSDPNLQAQARAAGGTPQSGSHVIGSDLLGPSSSSVQSPSPTAPRSRQNSPRPSIQHVLGNAPSVSTEMPVSSASDINLDSRTLPRPQISAGRTIVHGLKNGLQVATESADACPQLKSVLGFIRAIIKVSEQYKGNKEKLEALEKRLNSFELWKEGPEQDKKEVSRLKKLQEKLDVISTHLQEMSTQGRTERIANSAHDEAALSGYVADINEALTDYQVSLQRQLLQIGISTLDSVDLLLLNQLPRARNAGYISGNHQKCMKGTRDVVLQHIRSWAADPSNHRVYWLNGLAGVGKSTISQSFAEECFADGRLGASFFCSRDFTDRSDIHVIFPTLAYDLACHHPEFRAELLLILKSNPDIGSASLAMQLQCLLLDPLESSGISTVIVIDALDECKDKEAVSSILSLLGRHIGSITSVRFFITGRPEPRIQRGFRLALLKPYTEVFVLHAVEQASVDDDIRLYLKTQLLSTAELRDDVQFPNPWPNEQDISVLVRKSGGLFIFASTTCKFIASEHGNPHKFMQIIVNLPDSTVHEGSLGVDALYMRILEDNYASAPKNMGIIERLQIILGAIVLAFNPLSCTTLATLLELDPDDVSTSLRHLHSLLLVPVEAALPIRIFHKSFPDYITNAERCTNPAFCIQSGNYHLQFAIRCLQLMKTRLKRNICNLPRFMMNKDVTDLSELRKKCIGDGLEYACSFWAKHLCLSSVAEEDVSVAVNLLHDLLNNNLLSWLEVASICGELRTAAFALRDLQSWIAEHQVSNQDLINSVRDGERFLLRFFDPIQQSAFHIYESALPWSPELSLVRQRYLHPAEKCVKLMNAVDLKWDNCIVKIEVSTGIVGIAFSNNRVLFGCCTWNSLKLFEAATGSLYAEMRPKGDTFSRFAFSPDDALIATGSEYGWVSIWDVKTGDIVKVLNGHNSPVLSVAFSRQGVLASGSDDGIVWLWDLDSGIPTAKFIGDARPIYSLCWSPNNQELAVARYNVDRKMETVEIWNTGTQQVRKANLTQSYKGRIAYCPNGSSLASADGFTITIRDAQTGNITQTHSPSEEISGSICYSPSGTQIVYGTDRGLFIWDLETDVHQLICEVANLRYVAFSQDGSSIATASSGDSVIRIWRVDGAGIEKFHSSDEPTSKFDGLYMSWDGQRVVSTSKDGPMKLWDPATCMCLMSFNDPKEVYLATISNDNALVASLSWSEDSLQIWSCDNNLLLSTISYEMDRFKPTSLRFSPNARQIITVLEQKHMVLWDVETEMRIDEVDLSITRRSYTINGNGDFVLSSGKALLLPPSNRELKFYEEDHNTGISSIVSETTPDDERIRLAVSSSRRPVIDHAPLPEGYVPVVDDPFTETPPLSLTETGWVEDLSGRRLFWVPEDMRHLAIEDWSSRGHVWETAPGRLAFMECSDLL